MWLSAADSDDAETPPNRQRPVEKVRGQPGHPFVAVVRALQHLAFAHDRAAGREQRVEHARAKLVRRFGKRDVVTQQSIQRHVEIARRNRGRRMPRRSEEHTSELQSLMRNSYAVFCLKKKTTTN